MMGEAVVRVVVILACSLVPAMSVLAAAEKATGNGALKDLYFGEALFNAYQENYFDAISRLDTELAQYYGLDEPDLNSLYYHIDNVEFSVGDFELYFRMHNRASRAIKAVIEGNVEASVRNEAIYRLAKIYYQKQQPLMALESIEKVTGKVPEKLHFEEPLLRAQIYMENSKFPEAISLLRGLESTEELQGYAGYNLGAALFMNGNEAEGIAQLDKVGKIVSLNPKVLAMRDKANLVLGFRLLEAGQAEQAKQYLLRVRLTGPFSNKALLGVGWALAALGKFDRALVPWTKLSRRNITDKSVQEVLLGVPYAYAKLDIFGKAAVLYGQALDIYSKEISRLDASVASIREGKFLKAIIRDEIKTTKNWLINLRELPDAPETYYLTQMMASHDFQESLKNYFDLTDMEQRLTHWTDYLDAYDEIISIRSAYYEPLLPTIESQFRALDSKMKLRVEQRDKLDKRLKKMLVAPRTELLITVEERQALQKIGFLEKQLHDQGPDVSTLWHRLQRLKGIINWNIETEYHERFTKATEHLQELDRHVKRLNEIYGSFVRTRQAATQSYKGYDNDIQRLRVKMRGALGKVKVLLSRQGHLIEVLAVNELEERRKRLEEYQVKARFAMAESYDRANKAKQERQLEEEAKKVEAEKAAQEKLKQEAAASSATGKPEQETIAQPAVSETAPTVPSAVSIPPGNPGVLPVGPTVQPSAPEMPESAPK